MDVLIDYLNFFALALGLVLLTLSPFMQKIVRMLPRAVQDSRVGTGLTIYAYGCRWIFKALRWAALTCLKTKSFGFTATGLIVMVIFWLIMWTSRPGLTLALWLLVTVVAGVLTRKPKRLPWWAEEHLVAALTATGLTKVNVPVVISRLGKPQHSETGDTIKVRLPSGISVSDLVSRKERFAGHLRVPARMLTIAQEPDDAAGVCRITVYHPVSIETRKAAPALVSRTSWKEPVTFGRDMRASNCVLDTFEQNTLIAGMPGSGKTSLARIILAHYLLDPEAQIFLLDGKGSRKDYGGAAHLYERLVWGTEEDAPTQLVEMLSTVLEIVRSRNAGASEGGGVLLLLEELQDVRAGATKPEREEIDRTLGRIIRMGRAVGFHVIISTQRPTVDDLPSGARNLISQRVCLQVRNGADAAIVLGDTPTLPLADRRGQALYATPREMKAVTVDLLTDTDWRDVVSRATALRGTGSGPTSLRKGPVSSDAEEPTEGRFKVPFLLGHTLDVVNAAPAEGISPADLLDALRDRGRDEGIPTPALLSKALKDRWGIESVKVRVDGAQRRVIQKATVHDAVHRLRPVSASARETV